MGATTMVRSSATKNGRTWIFHGATPEEVADRVAVFLTARGFHLESGTNAAGVYGRGSAAGHAAFGGLAGRMKLNVAVAPEGGDVTVAISRGMGGWWGGLLGASRVRREFEGLGNEIPGAVLH